MAFANGSSHRLCYIKEDTFNVIPDTPTMQEIGITSCDLKLTRSSFQSATLRSDGQLEDITLGSNQVTNGFAFELNYGDYDDILAGAVDGEWVGNVLECAQIPQSFTFERGFGDVNQYGTYTGCKIDTFGLSVQVESIITGTFGIIGAGALPFSTTPLDASPLTPSGNKRYNSFTGTIVEGGSVIGVVTGIDLSLSMSRSLDMTIFSGPTASNINRGRAIMTGTLSAFFEDETLFNKFANETESSVEFTIGDGITKSYIYNISRLKYTDANINVSDEGTVTMSMPFTALLDSATGTNVTVTRIPGV